MTEYNLTMAVKSIFLAALLLISSCASLAPVQEMSNARQTLRLAKVAKAEIYAQDQYLRAQESLDQAVNQLNSGDYHEARRLALQAANEAKQAHLLALNHQKK